MLNGLTLYEGDDQPQLSLEASEIRYRRLFQTACDGILLLDAGSGEIIDANPTLLNFLGYRLDDVVGKDPWQIGILEDRVTNETLIRTLRQTHYVRLGNLSVQTRSGARRQVEFVANLYLENDETVIQCNVRDITERKGYESELAAANAQSSIILESMTDGFMMLDQDWKVTYVNEQAEQMLLRPADELIGRDVWEEFPEVIGQAFEREYRRAMKEQIVVQFEDYFAPLRTWFEVRAFPSDGGLSIYFTDITLRKKAENALKESEERLRVSTDGAGFGIWQYMIASDEVNFAPRSYELHGLPTDGSVSITRESLRKIMHPDDFGPVFTAFEKSETEGCDFVVDYRILGPNGSVRWIHCHGKPYRDDSGAVEWIQGVMSDITPQKVAEAERDAADLTNEHIVETLQRSLIQILPPGKFPGLEVEHLYIPGANAAEIGGDFFDTFALTETKTAFVIGDVLGKGLDAVGRTTEVKYALRALLHEFPEPDAALSRLNDFLHTTYRLANGNVATFVIIGLAVIDSTTGEAAFSSAGGEPTLILRLDGSTETVETGAVPLGILPDSQYSARRSLLSPGETIIMIADGVTQARRGADEYLGLNGVARLIETAGPNVSLEQLGQAIYNGAVEFAGATLRDDACLLLARRNA